MTELFYEGFDILLQILLLVIGALLVPYIKHKIGEARYYQIIEMVDIGVAAAEQIFRNMDKGEVKNNARYEYVAKYLRDKGVKIDDSEVKAMIEGAVLRINEVVTK